MTISFPTNIPSSEWIKEYLENLAQKLAHHNTELCLIESSNCFMVTIEGERPVSTKVIVIPIKEFVTYSKVKRSSKKIVDAYIINERYECTPIRFEKEDLNIQGFRNKLMMFQEYGLMTEKDYSRLYDLFMTSAKCGLPSSVDYLEEGLTYDRKFIIYKGSRIPQTDIIRIPDENTALELKTTFESFISCAPPEKSILLLMIQLIGLSMETIKALPPEKRRNCQPTVLPYIWGDSGCGKTTISKAFFDAHDESRFIALSTSTEAALQNKLSSVFGGVIVIDDVQHTGIGRCSVKTTEKLEAVIRTFGDIGAEKATASGKLPEAGAWAVVTAESIFTTVHSSILRLLPIEFIRGEIDFEQIKYLENRKIENEIFFLSYLEWFQSQVIVDNGTILDIKGLPDGYSNAKNELLKSYSDIPHARVFDNHCQILNFFNFISRFLGMIGVEESDLSNLKAGMLGYLHETAKLQCANIYESSLPFYISLTIDNILSEGNIARFNIIGSNLSKIEVPTGLEDATAFSDGRKLIFTVSQQREFFARIRRSLPNGSKISDKEIKQTLISMQILLNAQTDEPLTDLKKNNRIRINGKETRVLKIKINQLMEE